MFVALLFLAKSGPVLELNNVTLEDVIGGSKPAFVKFYEPDCPYCQALSPEFYRSSRKVGDAVNFASVDCTVLNETCDFFGVSRYPIVQFFWPEDYDGIDYDGDRNEADMTAFIQKQLESRRTAPGPPPIILSALTFQKFTRTSTCRFLAFFNLANNRDLLTTVRNLSNIFSMEPSVGVGAVNCGKSGKLCSRYNVTRNPTLIIEHNGETEICDQPIRPGPLSMYINQKCGTERGISGLLHNEAGTVPEADMLVGAFLKGVDKGSVIEQARKIPDARLYVSAMERVVEKGMKAIEQEVANMKEALQERQGSWKVLDAMKRRYNVFNRFLESPVETHESWFDPDDL